MAAASNGVGSKKELKNISIYTIGSRGDVQPFVAVGLGLKAQGYRVRFLTGSGHVSFIESFGLEATSLGTDFEEVMKKDPYMLRAMAEGSTMDFMLYVGHFWTSTAITTSKLFLKEMADNRPDLLLCGTLSEYIGWYTVTYLKIPSIQLKIEIMVNDPRRAPWGFPTLPFGLHQQVLKIVALRMYDGWKQLDKAMVEVGGERVCAFTPAQRVVEEMFKPFQPIMVLISPLYKDSIFPFAHDNLRFVGNCTIETKVQETNTNFGDKEQQETVLAFLKAEGKGKPVYMGWGSMICKTPQYMAEIAVHALYLTGQRGILLGGYAGLKEEMLDDIKDPQLRQKLKTYAKDNVLFVPYCPHALVLPNVSCIVHHGGAGTTNASLRAGVPTIITPIFWDQYDYSHLIQDKRVGVGFSKQFQRVKVEELAEAVRLCVTDPEIQKNAKEFSESLRDDVNGVNSVVDYVQSFWTNQVVPGKWEKEIQDEVVRITKIKNEETRRNKRRNWILGVGLVTGALYYVFRSTMVPKK